MRLLLDSHIVIWWAKGSPRLGQQARDLIKAPDADLIVSAASWWELGIKASLGRLEVDLAEMRRAVMARGVRELAVTLDHAEAAALLPVKHGDPFDHMLVAQAAVEGLLLLTRDKSLVAYGNVVRCI